MNFVCKFSSAPAKALQNFFHFFSWLVALYLFFACNSHAAPLPPSADNPLRTQAEVSFYIAENPLQIRILSNIVSVSVRPVPALEFIHATEVRVQSGRSFSIPLLLVNRGNVVTPYTLKLTSNLDDSPVLLLDADGNGRKDDGDAAFDMNHPRYLRYAGHDALLLTGTVPLGITEGKPYEIEVSARAEGANVVARARLKLLASSAPQATVTLNASHRVLDVEDTTTLTARVVNSGEQALQMAKSITIDGAAHSVTLLRYRIPTGMRYVDDGTAQAGPGRASTLLFASFGDADFQYRTQAGTDDVAEIAVAVTSALRPKEGLDLRFNLRLGDDADGSQIASHAEAFDDASRLAAASNIVMFDLARNDSPDIVPRIVQRDADLGGASTRIDIHVENIGASAATGTISMRGEVPTIIGNGDIGGANWQCTVARSTAGSAFECSSRNRLPAGGSTPPVSIHIANSESGAPAGSCGRDKKIGVVVSVPDEAQGLTGNNRAEAALMCKNGAVISGRAWIDAANNGIYTADQDGLSGWTAQLMREGNVIKEATTDRQGQYRITGIAPDGGYSLRFLSPQGRIEAPPLESRDGSGALVIEASRDFANGTLVYHEPLAPREYPDQDLALLPTGIIFDAQTAQPLANARVTLTGPKGFVPHLHLVGPGSNAIAVTDDKGRYNFFLTPDAPAGLYRWKVEAEGYATPEDEAVLELGEALGVGGPDEVRLAYKVFDGTGIPSFLDSIETPNPPSDTRARRLSKAASESLSAPVPVQRRNGYLAMSRVQGARKLANNHLGLFPVSGSGGLYLEKTADRKTVEIIDMFHYRIKIGHSQATTYNGFVINDSLPRGLRYVPGSARLLSAGRRGDALADPAIEQGADGGTTSLRFDFPDVALQSNLPVEISYRVAVGATVAEGARLISYASVSAGRQTAQGAAAVRIVGGVFSNDAFVLGKIFLDCNGDRLQGADEPGVPGVRVYLEDGSFAETDVNGNYSLYGLAPLTHVLKMDATTLPASARGLALSSRNAGHGDSRFLDLRNGELGRGDFALSCSDEIRAEVTYRKRHLADAGDELDSVLKLRFDAEAKPEERSQITPGSRSSGLVGDRAGAAYDGDAKVSPKERSAGAGNAEAGVLQPSPVVDAHLPPASPDNEEKRKKLDALLRGDATLRIVNLSDGQIMSGDFADVTVLGSNAAGFLLKVNGAAVPARQIGQRSELPSRKTAVWDYIAVRLRSGKNTISVEQRAGADMQRHEIEVIVPGPPARIEITAPQHLFADGKSAIALGIRLYDSAGLPATASDMVSLHTDLGSWITPDADPDEDGLQVLIRDGKATVLLKAPPEAGGAELSVEHGMLRQTQRLQFEPALRPMIAAGIFEGMVTLNNGKIEMAGGSGNNGFERQLRTFSRRSADGKREAAGRAALFLKGQVKGEYLLTAAFDSDKESRQRLFRDIEPDKYYPVYGDDSIRGFDAQASSKLYLRIDKGQSYLLYGDFNTAEASQMRQLTQYSRAVNGIRHHFEKGPFSGNFFASHDNLRQQAIEFRAANTRFYPGKLPSSYVEGSERVELITYDRSQSGIGQRIKVLSRYVDYTIEDLSGSFIVTRAETSNDPETGGENFYRIVFEVEDGAEQSWLYGGDITLGTAGKLRVGATAVNDDNPNQPRRLQGLFGSWQLGPDTEINGEYAWTYLGQDLIRNGSSDVTAGNGSGWRVGAKHSGAKLQSEWSALKTSPAYSNLSAPLAGGRFEARAKGVYRIDEETRVRSEALRTQDKLAGDGARFGSRLDDNGLTAGGDNLSYSGLLLGVERGIGPSAKAEVGTRIVRGAINRAGTAGREQPIDLLTLRTRVSSAVPGLPKASVYGEYEQDVRAQEKRALALGADYALSEKGRVYARHELISSLGSAYEIEENSRSYRTLIGIEGDYMKGGRAFSEYRGARPLTERGPEAAYGTRNNWRISDKLNMRSSFERTRSVSGASGQERRQSEATTVSSVFEYRHSRRLKGATGLDVRFGDTDTSYLYTLGIGYRLGENWTMLGKSAIYRVRGRGDGADARGRDTLRSRQRIGVAYRQTQGNSLNALAYYEHRHMRGGDDAIDKENTHIFSTHANFQPVRRWTLAGRYAAKYKTMGGTNGSNGIHGHLVSGRVTRDIGRYWDAGLAAAAFADSVGQRRQAYGIEIGHQLQDDLWLSAGYNVIGFVDRDFSGMAETGQGLYFRIRYKFDENSF